LSKLQIRTLVVALAFSAVSAKAEPYAAGDRIDAFTLEDQHGVAHNVDGGVALLLFSRDMEGGDLIKQALADAPAERLTSRHAVYVAEISRMPKMIAKMFALPSMRKRPYPMLLDRDGTTTARLPSAEGRATLIFLRDLEVLRVEQAETAAEVASALEPSE
jgi:hypothetical protein